MNPTNKSNAMSRIPIHRIAEHPGVFLREQIEEMRLDANRVARDTGLPEAVLREIACERCSVSAEAAVALGAYFGQSPEFWMNARKTHELSEAIVENGRSIRTRVRGCAGARPAP